VTGTWVQTTALMWLAYQLTGQSLWPSLISAAGMLPTFVLGAWGGVLVDRVPKRSLILATQTALLVLALLLAGLVMAGGVTAWQLLAVALAGGVVNALDLPARLAFVMDMVGREDVVNAVALNSLLFNAARAVGPWLGGLLLVGLGPGPCFLINGFSYLAVLAALVRMDVHGRSARPAQAGLSSLRGAWDHVRRRPALGLLIAMTGCISLFGWPYLSLLPALAHRGLGYEGEGYGHLLAGTGGGALLAALTLATLAAPPWRRRFLVAAVAAAVAGLVGLSRVHTLAPAVACCALVGFGLVLFNATSQSIVQLSTDDHNRGRVLGVWSMVICGAMPAGNLLVGEAADLWGEAWVLGALGVACLFSALAVLGAWAAASPSD
jgi:MFS family permease